MQIIPTSTRTLTGSGTFSFTLPTLVYNYPYGPIGEAFNLGVSFCEADTIGSLGGVGVSVNSAYYPFGPGPYVTTKWIVGSVSISCCGISASYSGTDTIITDHTGTYSVSMDTEFVSTYSFSLNTRQGVWEIQERPKVGGSVSVSVKFNGVTYSNSGTISAAYAYPLSATSLGHQNVFTTQLFLMDLAVTSTAAITLNPTWMGQTFSNAFTGSYGDPSAPFNINLTSGVYVSSTNGTVNPGGMTPGDLVITWQPTKQATIKGQVNAFEEAYPTTLVTEWQGLYPENSLPSWTAFNFGDTVSLDNIIVQLYGLSTIYVPFTTIYSFTQGDGLECRINPASLASAGEYGTAYLPARLPSFNMMTLYQASSIVLDPCTEATKAAVTLSWSSESGTFTIGETVTQAVTGAIGTVLNVDYIDSLIQIQIVSGTFTAGHVITGGTSGATANINGIYSGPNRENWTSNVNLVSGYLQVDTSSAGYFAPPFPYALGIASRGNMNANGNGPISAIGISEGYRYLQIEIEPNTQFVKLSYSSESGPFTIGETVNQATSGAVGIVISDNNANLLVLSVTSGTFVTGDLITGATSGYTTTPLVVTLIYQPVVIEVSDAGPSGYGANVFWCYQGMLGAAGSVSTLTFDLLAPTQVIGLSSQITITYATETGYFTVGEVVIQDTTFATGTVVSDSGTGTLVLQGVGGVFLVGDTIRGQTSGRSCVPVGVTGGNNIYVTQPTRILDSKITQSGGSGWASSEGPGWGIDQIWQLNLVFPAKTGTYTLKGISMVANNAPRVSFLRSLNSTPAEWSSLSSVTIYNKFALADTDGKRSFCIGDILLSGGGSDTVVGGGGTPYGNPSFTSQSNAITGWNAIVTASSTDVNAWYFDFNLSNLAGGGAIYAGTSPTVYWIDKALSTDAGSPTVVPHQAMAYQVLFPPQAGDIPNLASPGGPFNWYTWVFQRQRVTGVAIDKLTYAPISGATVTESQLISGTSQGSGTTDSEGRFITGDDYAQTLYGQQAILSSATSGTDHVSFQALPADILRVCFDAIPTTTETRPWQYQDNLGNIHLATVLNGDVFYRRADSTSPVVGWATAKTVTSFGDVQYARMAVDPQLKRIHMLVTRYTSGTYNVYWLYSDDDGSTFTQGTLLATNGFGVSVTELNISALLLSTFVYNSGTSGPGTQEGWYSQGSGQALSSVFTFKNSVGTAIQVADGGWSNVEEAKDNANALKWAPILYGNSSPTVLSSYDNGLTWG